MTNKKPAGGPPNDRSERYWRKDAEGDLLLNEGRGRFLRALCRHAPQVYEDLEKSVFPLYSQLFDIECKRAHEKATSDSRYGVASTYELTDLGHLRYASEVDAPERYKVMQSLEVWASRWNLRQDWILEHAVACLSRTKERLIRDPRFRGMIVPGWQGWSSGEGYIPSLKFVFSLTPDPTPDRPGRWQPEIQSWSAFETQVRADFENYLTEYKQQVEKWAIEKGYEKAPGPKRNRRHTDGDGADEHFRWLVLHLAEGLSYERIVERVDPLGDLNPQAVGFGVRDAAMRAGLSELVNARKNKPPDR
ncbi:hypothetical protein D3C87_1167510 [compost metagenome]